jgi:arylsulfatase A
MQRRSFLATLAAPLLAQTPRGGRRPNFVFFLADDMGYADIAPFGARDIATPHLNRLAREGVRMTDCYANAPVCTPTRCGFLTGRWQQRYKDLEWALLVPDLDPREKGKGLPASEPTIASLLKAAGYRTAIMGKWHLVMEPQFNPTRHGFDRFFGITSGNVDMYSHKYRTGLDDLWENDRKVKREGYLTDLLGDESVRWLEANHREPFFLYVPFNAVHWPFQVPGRPEDVRTVETWYDGTRADYARMTESMDANIGKVLLALDRLGVAENTLVVFTNDNGGERLSDNRPFFHHKATLWEGGIRVPAIACWPGGGIPAGKTTAQAAITMDFSVSMLAAAGVRAHPERPFDGMDLLPVLRGERPPIDRTLAWRINRPDRQQKAVRNGTWKWVNDGSIEQLFDLAGDPSERTNLAWQNPQQAARMRALYRVWEADVDARPAPLTG